METTINQRIASVINALNISKKAFADRLGVAGSVIYNIINNRNKPSFDLLEKMNSSFDINPNYLLTGEGEIFFRNDIDINNTGVIAVINADDFEKKQAGKMGGDFVTGLSQNDRKKINVESDGLPEISDKEHENSNLFMKNEQTDINEANRKNPDESLFNPYTNKTYRQFLYYDKMSINQLNLSYEAEYMLFKESYITRKKLLEVLHFIQPENFILEQFPLLPDFDLYFKALSEQWDKHFNTLIYNDILLTVKIMELKASREGEIMLLTKLINYLHMYQDMLTSSNNLKNKDITGQ